jgi:hypothetical protein
MDEVTSRLEASTAAKLVDAEAAGRSKTTLDDNEMTRSFSAIYAAYNLLVARVAALEANT